MAPEITVKNAYPTLPANAGEKIGVSLEVVVENEERPVRQFLHNGTVYSPVAEDVSQELIRLQMENELLTKKNDIGNFFDNLSDAANLTPLQKIKEALDYTARQLHATYAGIFLPNTSTADVPQVFEIGFVRPKEEGKPGEFQELRPGYKAYFEQLRQVKPELDFVETDREEIYEFEITPDKHQKVGGHGITSTLKPAGEAIATVQFLNIAKPLTDRERRIAKKCVKLLDSLVMNALHKQGSGEWVKPQLEDNGLGNTGYDPMGWETAYEGEDYNNRGETQKHIQAPSFKFKGWEPGSLMDSKYAQISDDFDGTMNGIDGFPDINEVYGSLSKMPKDKQEEDLWLSHTLTKMIHTHVMEKHHEIDGERFHLMKGGKPYYLPRKNLARNIATIGAYLRFVKHTLMDRVKNEELAQKVADDNEFVLSKLLLSYIKNNGKTINVHRFNAVGDRYKETLIDERDHWNLNGECMYEILHELDKDKESHQFVVDLFEIDNEFVKEARKFENSRQALVNLGNKYAHDARKLKCVEKIAYLMIKDPKKFIETELPRAA